MSRIRIEDLPVAENLTPEQEELIRGAGLRTIRPRLESLESRDMLDAGMGGAAISGLPPVTNQWAEVRLLAEQVSALQIHTNAMYQTLTVQNLAYMGLPSHPVEVSHELTKQLLLGLDH